MAFPFGIYTSIWGNWGYVPSAPVPVTNLSCNNTGNPPYAESDFLAFYPKFTGFVPDAVITAYIAMASASLNQARWKESWTVAMTLFTAHLCQLYLMTDPNPSPASAQEAGATGNAVGLVGSQGADALSVSYEYLPGDEKWGDWNQTEYGRQLIARAKIVGWGPIVVA